VCVSCVSTSVCVCVCVLETRGRKLPVDHRATMRIEIVDLLPLLGKVLEFGGSLAVSGIKLFSIPYRLDLGRKLLYALHYAHLVRCGHAQSVSNWHVVALGGPKLHHPVCVFILGALGDVRSGVVVSFDRVSISRIVPADNETPHAEKPGDESILHVST
jgi:hypothetical protein